MHRDVSQAAAVLGLRPGHLRKQLRKLGVLNLQGELACKHRQGPRFFVQTRQRWSAQLNGYVHYGVVMVTEAGIGWLAQQLGIEVVQADSPRQAG